MVLYLSCHIEFTFSNESLMAYFGFSNESLMAYFVKGLAEGPTAAVHRTCFVETHIEEGRGCHLCFHA